ncbi:Na+/H+ antiporter NhaC [Larsenimonas rhizosphaerae]|uniref:Na+/H+ antiporter NhaC n=1 Tax=Larsenimonas rhizosphaerae TaxID=2944682 RepID=UPI00203339F7|nr:Na+/H+ antiporter NhaC [Larsenimonas rhizosphaerae]MCM2129553.1 Na+/H+ antiporter NhaC [Larsenimonas rhizosphaerae]
MTGNIRIGKTPGLAMALAPLLLTVSLLMVQFFVFNDFTPHIPLACGIIICALFARIKGVSWQQMEASMLEVIKLGVPAILILLAVGMVIGSWILSGTVPTLIYYGIELVSPGLFLVATSLISALVSLAIGTSWGTIGTLGLALMGIGQGLGIPVHLTAGALVSGAFFGDKMSPLSDTTNLTPAVCETDLWSHIRGMMATTIPAMTIALALYAWLGMSYADSVTDTNSIAVLRSTLASSFTLSWITLIPPVMVIGMAVARLPPFPSIFAGAAAGGIIALTLQGSDLHTVVSVMQNGYESQTGNAAMDQLLSNGGVMSMAWVVTLTLFALSFTGMLEAYGTIDAIMKYMSKLTRGRFSLVLTSSATTASVGVVVGDVYTTLVLPGRLLRGQYQKMGYSTTTLSRSIEDNGTLLSPLIPWNMGGAFVASTIGVPTLLYAPFAFACWLSPLIGLFWALIGRFIPEAEPSIAPSTAPPSASQPSPA